MKLNVYIYNINITNRLHNTKKKVDHQIDAKPKVHTFTNTLRVASDLITNLKFKPVLKLRFYLLYGLDNAAYTAILHGLITSAYPTLLQLLELFFNMKENDCKIEPEFNKFVLKLEIDSIISINLAKVIYILFVIYKVLRKSKRKNLANT
jgi:hypothetical protein